MKEQKGALRLTGTAKHSDITFYERDGVFLWRKKTSLTKERVKKDPAFARSRRASDAFGKASILAKKVYWQLPEEKRKHRMFGQVTKFACKLLKEGVEETEAIRQMMGSLGV